MYTKAKTWREEFKKSGPVFQLINRYFWKTKIGPIFSLLFPLLIIVVYFTIGKAQNDMLYVFSALPTTLSLSVLPLILLTLPTMNIEFRNSIILRKIKIIGIGKLTFICISYILFSAYSLMFTIIGFFLFCCFLEFNTHLLSSIDWGSLIYGWIVLVLSGIGLGLLLSIASKTSLSSQLIGFGVLLLTLIFSGQFMPLSVIGTIEPIKYISLLSPLTYSANIFNVAIYAPLQNMEDTLPKSLLFLLNNKVAPSNSIFNFHCAFWLFQLDFNPAFLKPGNSLISIDNNGAPSLQLGAIFKVNAVYIYDIWQKVLFVFCPLGFTVIFNWIFYKKFKWINR